MIGRILDLAASGRLDDRSRAELRNRVTAGTRLGRDVVNEAEQEVKANPLAAFSFDSTGHARLRVRAGQWDAGKFEPVSIEALRQRAETRPHGKGSVKLHVLRGNSELSDVAALQAFADAPTLFQVASQFNALEAPGPSIVPVSNYFGDPTQGPRASISAFPATLLRHYAAPASGGARFTQRNGGSQINLLESLTLPGVARVTAGYLRAGDIEDPAKFAGLLRDQFDKVRVGVHAGVEVVRGTNWDGPVAEPHPRIAQVLTSTLAAGGYSPGVQFTGHWETISRLLLRGAYLGTLLAAVSLEIPYVVLTSIGGGVFGNPHELIREAIAYACDEVARLGAGPLDVVVNIREQHPSSWSGLVAARGGLVIEV